MNRMVSSVFDVSDQLFFTNHFSPITDHFFASAALPCEHRVDRF